MSLIDNSLSGGVTVAGTFETMPVSPREASIVATIVNELAANAAKHSFRNSAGAISVAGTRIGDAGYRLECSDSGGGDADDGDQAAEPGGRAGLGLKILQASVRQLSGTMAAGRDSAGYSTRLEFSFTGD